MPKSTASKSLLPQDESLLAGLCGITDVLRLANSQNALDRTARRIIEIARQARVSRDMELCSRASSAVLALPVSEGLRSVAEFYADVSQRAAAVDAHGFRQVLARKIASVEPAYVARIILEVALAYDREGNLSEALRYYLEAAKAAGTTDGLTSVQAAASLALLRSDDGYHHGALQEHKRLFPIIASISHTYPHLYYSYANDRAVVLSRAGRAEESRRALQVALASSLEPMFPEWRETASEIEEIARREARKKSLAQRGAQPAIRVRGSAELRGALPAESSLTPSKGGCAAAGALRGPDHKKCDTRRMIACGLSARADSGMERVPRRTTTRSLSLNDESSFVGLSKIAGALHLVNSQSALDSIAREMIEIARRARLSLDMELCSKASSAVLALPLSEGLRSVAEVYDDLSCRAVMFDARGFRQALARRASSIERPYIARVIVEIAQTYDLEGDLSEALRYYVEAMKAAKGTDGLAAVHAAANMALLRSDDGDHHGALRELERLFPIIGSTSYACPHLYYSYANNRAVVLSRAGRTEEARRSIRVALASPLAPRFPEWRDTAREIEEAARRVPSRKRRTQPGVQSASRVRRSGKPRGASSSKAPLPPLTEARGVASRLRNWDRRRCDVIEQIMACVHPRDRPIVSGLHPLWHQCSKPQQSRTAQSGRVQGRAPPGGGGIVYLDSSRGVVCPYPLRDVRVCRGSCHRHAMGCPPRAPPYANRLRIGVPDLPPGFSSSTTRRPRPVARNLSLARSNPKHCRGRCDSADQTKKQADGCCRRKFHPSASAGHRFKLALILCPWRTL
jgi:tetratricopeptide (TPR) repeat protein